MTTNYHAQTTEALRMKEITEEAFDRLVCEQEEILLEIQAIDNSILAARSLFESGLIEEDEEIKIVSRLREDRKIWNEMLLECVDRIRYARLS